MSEPVRLAKRVVEIAGCSRQEAEQYIEGGWVLVDGETVDEPQRLVGDALVTMHPQAQLGPVEPATFVLHKPAGIAPDGSAAALLNPGNRSSHDNTGSRVLRRHFLHLTPVMPLEKAAAGIQVFTQDGRLLRRMREDATRIEQEFIVEVAGEIAPYGLRRLEHGLSYNGRVLPPIKVSWQNEIRLRFAIKAVQPGQLQSMCADVGLTVVAMKRIRLGRIPLGKMPVSEWRYLPADERF